MAEYYTQFCVEFEVKDGSAAHWEVASILKELKSMTQEYIDDNSVFVYRLEDYLTDEGIVPDGTYTHKKVARTLINDDGDTLFTHELQYAVADNTIFLYAMQDGNPLVTAQLIQFLLMRYQINEGYKVVLKWAYTCSEPEPDAFGGGMVIITKDQLDWILT